MKTVTSQDINGNTHEVPVSELSWRPSVYGIVIKGDNVLLVPQFTKNRYDLPGGGVDLGETFDEAVIREVKEETGFEVANPRFAAIHSNFFTFSHDTNDTAQCILLYYTCDLVGGELSTDGFDESEKNYASLAVWFPIDKLDSIQVSSSYDFRETVKQTQQ